MFNTEGSFQNLNIQKQKSYLMAAKTSSSSPISSLSPQEHSSCPVESSLFISILGRLQSQWWSSCWYSSTPMTIIKWQFLDNLPSTMCALTNSLVITNTQKVFSSQFQMTLLSKANAITIFSEFNAKDVIGHNVGTFGPCSIFCSLLFLPCW